MKRRNPRISMTRYVGPGGEFAIASAEPRTLHIRAASAAIGGSTVGAGYHATAYSRAIGSQYTTAELNGLALSVRPSTSY